MWKRTLVMTVLVAGMAFYGASEAQAWGRYRHGFVVRRPVVAPVRRVAVRTVLPPYPVTRRMVARPYVRAYPAYPIVYGPGVHVRVGY